MKTEVGEVFSITRGKRTDRYRRESDDKQPMFECEKIRITHLSCSTAVPFPPYTFGAEPEWFRQRGLEVPDLEDV